MSEDINPLLKAIFGRLPVEMVLIPSSTGRIARQGYIVKGLYRSETDRQRQTEQIKNPGNASERSVADLKIS